MPEIELTEQEKQTLTRCLNERLEPPEELAKKLFPKLYAGFGHSGSWSSEKICILP